MSTFTNKNLRFTFILSNNSTFNGSNNTLQISGMRSQVNIKGAGLPAFPEATMTIFGLKLSDMTALTALAFQPTAMERNIVIVEADSGSGFSTVFKGQIVTAGPNFDGMPAVSLEVSARILGFESLNPVNPLSYNGVVNVADIAASIVSTMGSSPGEYVLENNGVTSQLTNPYFSGTAVDQLRALKQAANIEVYPEGNIIAICPAKGRRKNIPEFVLDVSTGLVGNPKLDYNRGYVYAKAFFNPAFRFGGPLTLSNSLIPLANGKWTIGTISHDLNSLTYGGPWFSDLLLYPASDPPPIS